jgi:hypothetical protein
VPAGDRGARVVDQIVGGILIVAQTSPLALY